MIEVKNLTKTYGKNKNAVKALQGVSFTLPDKGLVFIVGKSGSGKSTLLNILGGLDDATSGEIFVDGCDITKLKPNELDNYRNYFVGIVYQHFNLFEDETVLQNIKIATDISDKNIDNATIDNVIDRLDLSEKKNTLVRELSGGQKQRVAIARALAKYPRMILADEPTGNLDSKTSIAIHNYLQRISKEKLVVVISHDMKSANKYADRIIEISDGFVINNLIKDENGYSSNEISVSSDVSDEKINEINEILKDKGISLTKKESGFIQNDLVEKYEGENISFKERNKSYKSSFKLAQKFWKSSKGSFFIALAISTLVVSLLSLAHGFAVYDGSKAVSTAVERYDARNFVVQKGYSVTSNTKNINQDYILKVPEEDRQDFSNVEKYGKVHEIYPLFMYNGAEKPFTFSSMKDIDNNILDCSLGMMTVDKTYLDSIFDGVTLLGGSMYGLEKSTSFLITDFMADSILAQNKLIREDGLPIYSLDPNDPYQGLLGSDLICSTWYRYRIAGIIKTDYKVKYEFIYKMLEEISKEPQNASSLQKRLLSSDLFIKFQNDIRTKYGFTYTFNQNILEDYISENLFTFSYLKSAQFIDKNGDELAAFDNKAWIAVDESLKKGEILLSDSTYQNIYKKSSALDNSLIFEMFDFNQVSSDIPMYYKTFTVKGKIPVATNASFVMNKEDFKEFCRIFYTPFAFSFEDVINSYQINNQIVGRYYYSNMQAFESVFQLINIIKIFSEVFLFIAILLMALVALVIISHSLRIIKKNQYRLGVYKSLGYSTAALANSTIINSMFLVLSLVVFSTLFMLGLSNVMNMLLTSSFSTFIGNDIYLSLTLVEFSFPTLAIYLGAVLVLALASTFIPVISIRKIKPNIIINKAD